MHQVLTDCLVSLEIENMDIDSDNPDPFEEYLVTALYAICSAFHKTHGYPPGQVVFKRDMFMPTNLPIDWKANKERKQKVIGKSNERENSKRIHFQYKKGDYMTFQKSGILRKLSVSQLDPYKVLKHHANGDMTYEKELNVTDKVNIRCVYPYYKKQ